MAEVRRCNRCSDVYYGDGYLCPRCWVASNEQRCNWCSGAGCPECRGEPGCCLSGCAGWIGALVVAMLLAPVIMHLTGGNPLEGLVDWLNSSNHPGNPGSP
jgi:hypothetical protein